MNVLVKTKMFQPKLKRITYRACTPTTVVVALLSFGNAATGAPTISDLEL